MSVRNAFEPVAWWVVLFALYLAVISTISLTEIVVAAAGDPPHSNAR